MTDESLLSEISESIYYCSSCGTSWNNRKDFLTDPDVKMLGYQVHFECLKLGFFLFNHSCGSTFSLKAGEFFDLYNGEIFEERKTGSNECPRYCLRQDCMEPCPAKCECAFVRDIIRIIKTFPKKE